MKKVLIVLLSVLLALTFISCEKDKSGEVIQNYEDFMNSYNAHQKVSSFCDKLYSVYKDEKTGKVEDKEFGKEDNETILSALKNCYYYGNAKKLLDLLDIDADIIEIQSVESVSGKFQGTYSDYTASDIVIKFTYITTTYVNGGDSKKSDPTEGELKINVKYSYKNTDETSTLNISSLSLQGVSYKDIMLSSNQDEKLTSATVGGVAVELRLLQPCFDNMKY